MYMDSRINGIALSGGGARGIAHIGVLKAFEEYKIDFQKVSGASMGAIVGVLYASGYSSDEIARILKEEKIYKWFKIEWFSGGLLSLDRVKDILYKYVKHNDFSKLEKQFSVSISNLNKGKGEMVNKGTNLLEYVIASASVPLLFTPVTINGFSYIDGGLFNNLPTETLVGDSDYIFGSNMMPLDRIEKIDSAKQVADRVFSLAIAQNVWRSRNYCDFFIEPRSIVEFATWDYSKIDELIEVGYKEAIKVIKRFVLSEFKELQKE